MKSITVLTKSILSVALMTMFSFAFVSCYDDDPADDDWYDSYNWYNNAYDYTNWDGGNSSQLATEASVLCHPWSGTLVYYYYSNGKQQTAQMNVDILFDRYDSNSVNGRGQETDYDSEGNTQVLKFAWYIDPKTENIYIKYDTSGSIFYFDASRSDEYGFVLDSNSFSGYALGKNVDEALDFDLTRASLAKSSTRTASAVKSSLPMKLVKR
jgi:hypothetical protein